MAKKGNLFLLGVFIGIGILNGVYCSALTVEEGLTHYQVVQANEEDKNYPIHVKGKCNAEGTIEMRVMSHAYELIPWREIGTCQGTTWEGQVSDIPVGGPYRIEFRIRSGSGEIKESLTIYEVLVGDVWILAGQSNMYGVGNMENTEIPNALVHVYSMGYRWQVAKEPLHLLEESPDTVHCKITDEQEKSRKIVEGYTRKKGAGLGLPFAVEMVKRTGRPVGLIASAHGGTSMTQWDPALKEKGGESLYGSMFKQVMSATNGRIKGVLWYQGESDANKDAQPYYKERMRKLVQAFRTDFQQPNFPFYYVQIGRFVVENNDSTYWDLLQHDQVELEPELAPGGMVSSIDLELDDLIHIGTEGLKTLGYRLANLVERDFFGGTCQAGPRISQIERAQGPYGPHIKVKLTGVNGRLRISGRVAGFSISGDPQSPNLAIIYDQTVSTEEPNTIILWLTKMPEQAYLWYGRGFDPYCNVVDESNMALPACGPLPIP